jgi:hypothetical protein
MIGLGQGFTVGQAVTANVTMKRILWGCPGMNFKYTLPFHKMR